MQRPYQSLVPAAITALVAYVKQATATIADLEVHDGPWVLGGSVKNVIVIGWEGFPTSVTRPAMAMEERLGAPDITSTGELLGLGPGIMETFNIACACLARDGTSDIPTARANAYSYQTLVGQILASREMAGQQIGGVMQAIMSTTHDLHQVQDKRGALAVVTFNIQCKAFAQQ